MKQPVNSFPYFVRTLAKYEIREKIQGTNQGTTEQLAFQKNTVYRRILIKRTKSSNKN